MNVCISVLKYMAIILHGINNSFSSVDSQKFISSLPLACIFVTNIRILDSY